MDGGTDYQKVQIKSYPAKSIRDTAEGRYWRRFQAPKTTEQIGVVSHISYSPVYPHDFAVTTSTRVLVYHGQTHALKRTLARFPDTAYCGTYRSDGKLLVAGCESGIVQVFDLSSRNILRQYRGHARPTHACLFTPNKLQVLTGSDDATVRLWDLTGGEQIARFDGHADYVRAAACASDTLWATGSYDHTAQVWDPRTKGASMVLQHGAPVESVAFFPSGNVCVTGGGSSVCVWDIVGGGRLLQRLTNHQKTVTAVSVVDVTDVEGRTSSRLLSGALDGHVKVYDLDTFHVSYAFKYPAPVLAVAVAPSLASMTVGMADKTMVVRRHKNQRSTLTAVGAGGIRLTRKERSYAPRLTAATYKYFMRGKGAKAAASDVVIQARRKAKLREFDTLLKHFRYAEALDAAFRSGRADVVASVIEELSARVGLTAALSGRKPDDLVNLLQHTCKYITHPHHSGMMLHVVNRILDLYSDVLGKNEEVDGLLDQLRGRVAAEVSVQQELQQLQGSLDLLVNMSYAL